MSNEIHCVEFNDGKLRLDIAFSGDNFETAEIKWKLVSKTHGVLQESPAIPMSSLFDIVALVDIAIREKIMRYEQTLRSMKESQNGKEG